MPLNILSLDVRSQNLEMFFYHTFSLEKEPELFSLIIINSLF
jgi:hypothetical protein